jgi:hypothetical protein
MSEFKTIQHTNLIRNKKYLIQDESNDIYTCYYDGSVVINTKVHVIFIKLKNIYDSIIPFKVYKPTSIKIYYYYGKKEIAQNNMENRALVNIFKKIIDENFDIGMKVTNINIQFDELND